MLVLGLVLSEGTVALEKLVEHTPETEPVRAGVVGSALGQDLRGHVAVSTNTGMRTLFTEIGLRIRIEINQLRSVSIN